MHVSKNNALCGKQTHSPRVMHYFLIHAHLVVDYPLLHNKYTHYNKREQNTIGNTLEQKFNAKVKGMKVKTL